MGKRRRQKQEALKLQLGWKRGWGAYRHGTSKPISLASPNLTTPIFSGARRKHAVSAVMDVLRDWRLSPFEHEAGAIAGLRSGLCLKGYGFARSETEAYALVADGLRILGAKRPTWEQGQREYVDPRENCAWCGGPKDEFQTVSRFCSPRCASLAVMHRGYEDKARDDVGRARTLKLARRLTRKPRDCLHCGKAFHPEEEALATKFCSRTCAYDFQHTEAAKTIEHNCATCGASFRSVLKRAMYCSPVCNNTAQRRKRGVMPRGQTFARTCECCGTAFETTSPKAIFCSTNCVRLVSRLKTGNNAPKRVSPLVLDYLLHGQGLAITDERMAA